MNSLKKREGVPLLNFAGGPGNPLLNFEGGPGVPLLNFRVVPGPTFELWGVSESRIPGSWSHFYTMPFTNSIINTEINSAIIKADISDHFPILFVGKVNVDVSIKTEKYIYLWLIHKKI